MATTADARPAYRRNNASTTNNLTTHEGRDTTPGKDEGRVAELGMAEVQDRGAAEVQGEEIRSRSFPCREHPAF